MKPAGAWRESEEYIKEYIMMVQVQFNTKLKFVQYDGARKFGTN